MPVAKKIRKPLASKKTRTPAKRVWDIVAEATSDLPEKAWKNIPSDLGKYSDHYLYGGPKE